MSIHSDKFTDDDRIKDMLEIHQAAFREKSLPEEGLERGPWWLYTIIISIIAFGFFYIGHYWGEFSFRPHVLYSKNQPAESAVAKVMTPLEIGKQVYTSRCVACHQSNGNGLAGVFPTLSGTDYVLGSKKRLSALLLNGLQGDIIVKGQIYNGNMPAWKDVLTDEEIAAVATFIRANFGNQADELSPELVKEVRTETSGKTDQWTEPTLSNTFSN